MKTLDTPTQVYLGLCYDYITIIIIIIIIIIFIMIVIIIVMIIFYYYYHYLSHFLNTLAVGCYRIPR